MSDMSAVVFPAGEHRYEGASGVATVHVPHDVVLCDIEHALTKFIHDAIPEEKKEVEDAA